MEKIGGWYTSNIKILLNSQKKILDIMYILC